MYFVQTALLLGLLALAPTAGSAGSEDTSPTCLLPDEVRLARRTDRTKKAVRNSARTVMQAGRQHKLQ
jgi:hypothetical protein